MRESDSARLITNKGGGKKMADTLNNGGDFASMAIQNAKDISELRAEITALNKRIDDNDQLTNGIHELATNVATMSLEIKMLTEKFDSSITRIENGLQKQSDRISVIENAPSQKWDKFVWLIIAAAVSALVSFIAGGLL